MLQLDFLKAMHVANFLSNVYKRFTEETLVRKDKRTLKNVE